MQKLAHLRVDGKVVLVLARLTKQRQSDGFYISLKLRASGKPGKELTDESEYLKHEPQKLAALLAGKVVKC